MDTEPDEVIVTRLGDHVGVVQAWHTGDGITLSLDMWEAGDDDTEGVQTETEPPAGHQQTDHDAR